ncbi:MAG: thymidine phosphorylase [Treponema sp.]|nr:thymidine phosphorylase [Treponema sp.]MBP3607991.1 thymidine phosphorylase [Treponema sp.]
MRATDIIMKKRGFFLRDENGNKIFSGNTTLSKEEIKFMIDGYTEGKIPDYQMSSFLMAIYFNGMTFEETGVLTECMLHSGETIKLHGFENIGLIGPFIDKHSTGGVGDKISLPLAPIVSACGIQDPMMSGRALGHTGGTLDKLESIEGYNVNLTEEEFRQGIKKNGFAMMGQTPLIAPADKKMYALRDVTATVESIPLITSSILSKKVAEGADGLVFDVKCGSGAFMKSFDDAKELAEFLVKTAQSMGKKATALITRMDTPLGKTVGNFLEIEETIECLQGKGPEDVMELTYALATEMLLLGNKAKTKEEALALCKEAVSSGKALDLFLKNVKEQGGNPDTLLSQIGKRRSSFHAQILAEQDGYITLDAFKTGIAGVYLGVGRNKSDEKVYADAGFIVHKKTGDYVKKGDLILDVYGKNKECLEPTCNIIKTEALTYSNTKPELKPLILMEVK